jgi:hypothetical protein
MGLAGYDIINLLKPAGSSSKKYVDSGLGTDDVSGLSILNILKLSVNEYDNDTIRTTKIKDSKSYLDSASALLHKHLNDNSTDPLDTDEILLDTFALSFAMQLNQLIIYDNATTSTTKFPDNNSDGSLDCDEATASTASQLRAMDGHLWTAERDGIQCARMKSAIAASDNQTEVLLALATWKAGQRLPPAIYLPVCEPILSLTSYLDNLTESINKLTTLSGDNTKAISDAKTSTDNLTKTVGCVP